jgi:WD40 repeat protein
MIYLDIGDNNVLIAASFSPFKDDILVTVDEHNNFILWNFKEKKTVKKWKHKGTRSYSKGMINFIEFNSKKENELFVYCSYGPILVYDTSTGKLLRKIIKNSKFEYEFVRVHPIHENIVFAWKWGQYSCQTGEHKLVCFNLNKDKKKPICERCCGSANWINSAFICGTKPNIIACGIDGICNKKKIDFLLFDEKKYTMRVDKSLDLGENFCPGLIAFNCSGKEIAELDTWEKRDLNERVDFLTKEINIEKFDEKKYKKEFKVPKSIIRIEKDRNNKIK